MGIEPLSGVAASGDAYRAIVRRLRLLRRRAVAVEVSVTLTLALAWLGLGLLLWALAEALFYLPPLWRGGLGAALALGVCTFVAQRLRHRLPPLLDPRRLALRVEERHPALQQRLISALELWEREGGRRYSETLLAATVRRAADELEAFDGSRLASARQVALALRPAAAAGLALAAGWLTPGSPLGEALYRCLHPSAVFARPARTRVAVSPGDMRVVKGDDAVLRIYFAGEAPLSAAVARRDSSGGEWTREEVVSGGVDSLSFVFKQVRRPFSYRVEAGDGISAEYRVEVIEPPAIQRLRLRYTFPAYSGLPPRVEEESGDIRALAGTRVDFEIQANKELARATMVIDDTLRLDARVEGASAHLQWRVEAAGHYRFDLLDPGGVANREPIRYAVQVLRDMPPRVEFTDPGRDTDLPETRRIPLALEAEDDYGIDRVDLVFRVNDSQERRLPLPAAAGTAAKVAYLWDLAAYGLLPEDRVFYRAEAFDNDAVQGPKVGVSREYVLRFPSLQELYEEIDAVQRQGSEELQRLVEEGRENRERVEGLRRELLRHQELSWEQRQELEETLEAEAERLERMDELASRMEEAVEEAERNDLASDEVLEKLQTIRELMQEVATPEMQDALAELQEAMEEMDPDELAEALKQFSEDQEAFQERLDRTIALLEQVRAEQELEAAVRQAADLAQRQERINESLADGDRQRQQAQEEDLAEATDALQEDLESLSETMEGLEEQTAADLEEQAAEMQQQALAERMRQMAQQIQQGQMRQAGEQGSALQQDLQQMAMQMQNLQRDFAESQKEELSQDMRQAMRQLLGLSHRQEDLRRRTQVVQRDPSPLAGEQFALAEATGLVVERVAGVAERTLSVEHGLAPTLGRALQRMQAAAGHLGQRYGAPAADEQEGAMGHINEAVLLLRQSLDNLSQAQMPSAFAEAMQQMMGLAQQQGQLNAQSQAALQGQQPGPGNGIDVRRLAAQQRRLYQALEQLESGMRGRRGAERRLEEIQEEMRGVISDLDRRRLDAGVLERQRRIEQRLLEASRSIHTRGHESQRRGESAEAPSYDGPDWLPEDLGQARDALRRAMKEALEGPYPEAYRQAIRRYYEDIYQDLVGEEP